MFSHDWASGTETLSWHYVGSSLPGGSISQRSLSTDRGQRLLFLIVFFLLVLMWSYWPVV